MKKKYQLIILILIFSIPFLIFAGGSNYQQLLKKAKDNGFVKIILKLKVENIDKLTMKSNRYKTVMPGGKFPSAGIQADLELEQAIENATFSTLYKISGKNYQLNHTFSTIPYMALDVSPEALSALALLPDVLEIYEDMPNDLTTNSTKAVPTKKPLIDPNKPVFENTPLLDTSTGLIGATNAWAMGYTGSGWYVAVLDTGILRTHQFFQGKTIKEACFSANGDCPNGLTSMTGTGAAVHYDSIYYGYDHGTHVAGIAVGNYGSHHGVAKNSNLIAVQVFSKFGPSECDGDYCVLSYDSDQVKGLEYIYTLRSTYSIASVNMSLGGGAYSSYCDGEPQKDAIVNLEAVNIATVIATGNDGYCSYVSSPACISSAIAVGASDDRDVEAYFNNWHDTLQELFAPGVGIESSTGDSNSSYESWSGTSMATPHVSGAWALMRQASPNSSVSDIYNALRNSGDLITTLCFSGETCPRIQVDDAIVELTGVSPTIRVTSPNGGEEWKIGTAYNITWTSTGSVGNVEIEYTIDNGSSWTTLVSSINNDGSYTWMVPDTPSTQCKIRIKEASDGSPSDTSNATFSIVENTSTSSIRIMSPNGGEEWEAGSTETIKWSSMGTFNSVKIQYSTNNGSSWANITSSTANDGSYSWKIPNKNSTSCLVKISDTSDATVTDISDTVFSIIDSSPPEISLSRTTLNFSGIVNQPTLVTGVQKVWINNSGGGTLNWSSMSSAPWLNCTPTTGTNSGALNVTIQTTGLAVGNYSGLITMSAIDATNSPLVINVNLKILKANQDQPPFGEFATPTDQSVVRSSIPVTGWVLDDVDIQGVRILIDNNPVGDAVFVEGARPDVEQIFSDYPKNYQAGWGYMLLTNVLTDGSHSISAVATDNSGTQVNLGTKTITIDNASAVKPFGAIDSPAQGGGASGSSFRNQGWVLTPQPNRIPEDGSTIKVYVDGQIIGNANYNIYRADIGLLFPGYANSMGALGYLDFDTTNYENGVHTIGWTATDSGNNIDGIGSRFFNVENSGTGSETAGLSSNSNKSINNSSEDAINLDLAHLNPMGLKKGYNSNSKFKRILPDKNGNTRIEIKELERMVLELPLFKIAKGYHEIAGKLRPLPIGTSFDRKNGLFYWQPGPGFIGTYQLVFLAEKSGKLYNKRVIITISTKTN